MKDLPLLTEPARKVLRCCIKDLCDVRKGGDKIRSHMIYTYLAENATKPLSKHEIDDCLSYIEAVGLLYDVERNIMGKINCFRLNHMGAYYFDLEKMLKNRHRRKILCESFLLPVVVSIITALLTLLIAV